METRQITLQDQGGRERQDIANYLTCELESPDDVVDAFGLNAYSWCDPATWRLQGLEFFMQSMSRNRRYHKVYDLENAKVD